MSDEREGTIGRAVGATWLGNGLTHFRVWAPARQTLHVVFTDVNAASTSVERVEALRREPDGHFSGSIARTAPGMCYRFSLDDPARRVPDPASRYQPEGPHGPSMIVDPGAFAWRDAGWRGIRLEPSLVLYELHIGTFTPAGTWRAAARELPRLAACGITAIEMMPVAEFAGTRGWGYDGVDLFAPSHLYGTPDDLRFFVDEAHRTGIGVILDVVYNHFGPDGNYLRELSAHYFTTKYDNEWGDAINFDDGDAGPVRELIAANAAYWIDEFHMDGLRVDATQQMFDASTPHILATIGERARTAARGRAVLLIAENESQDPRLLRPVDRGGYGFDAVWNDDFHHAALVALTGQREAYYTDYTGAPQELVSLVKWGYLYQGQRYAWQDKGRGGPTLDVAAPRFVTFLENHDQVANTPSGRGERVHQRSSPALYRAITAYWLLAPGTPMFFQGQEYGADEPFVFFAGHTGELGDAVRRGRAQFMSQFRSAASRPLVDDLPPPDAVETFERCRLSSGLDRENSPLARLHRDLLRLRRDDDVIGTSALAWVDGAVVAEQVFLLRWFVFPPRDSDVTRAARTRILVVNLGVDRRIDPAADPFLAPPAGMEWSLEWSSEDPAYGGSGTAPPVTGEGWRLPAQCAVLLRPVTTVTTGES